MKHFLVKLTPENFRIIRNALDDQKATATRASQVAESVVAVQFWYSERVKLAQALEALSAAQEVEG